MAYRYIFYKEKMERKGKKEKNVMIYRDIVKKGKEKRKEEILRYTDTCAKKTLLYTETWTTKEIYFTIREKMDLQYADTYSKRDFFFTIGEKIEKKICGIYTYIRKKLILIL